MTPDMKLILDVVNAIIDDFGSYDFSKKIDSPSSLIKIIEIKAGFINIRKKILSIDKEK